MKIWRLWPRASLEVVRHLVRPGASKALRAIRRDVWPGRADSDLRRHLEETLAWLSRAHDATGRKGVSRSFSLRCHHRYGRVGWLPAYPETTGYIIPTLYEAAGLLERPELAARAEEMASWEVEIQMDSGAVRGGTLEDAASPAVFNTGQVMFGWLRAAAETGDAVFDRALGRSAKFLIQSQDADGGWRRGASSFAEPGGHVYNARTGWALCSYGKRVGDAAALAAAQRAGEFAVANQQTNGWFAHNCLTDNARPLTHTIAYAAQGLLEMGILLAEDRFIVAATRAANGVMTALHSDGFLPGRLDWEFKPAVTWTCLTGAAQMVLVWERLAELDGDARHKEAADRALGLLLSLHDVTSPDPGVRGGLAGSYPIWGGYGTYELLNWAAKFLADGLIGRLAGRSSGTHG